MKNVKSLEIVFILERRFCLLSSVYFGSLVKVQCDKLNSSDKENNTYSLHGFRNYNIFH
jgi:hypothetical protein